MGNWASASNIALFAVLSANSSVFRVIVVTILTTVVPVSGVIPLPAVHAAFSA